MSTEKDREDAEKWAESDEHVEYMERNEDVSLYLCSVKGFEAGIQHARQGERERLVCFAERIRIFLRDYSGVHSYAHEINVVINDFLEQEKS